MGDIRSPEFRNGVLSSCLLNDKEKKNPITSVMGMFIFGWFKTGLLSPGSLWTTSKRAEKDQFTYCA